MQSGYSKKDDICFSNAATVGRTQDLVYNLHVMIENGEIPNLPVFVDSPLAI